MAKDPAFLFYPNDFLGGTLGMTFEEKGAYIELLMVQFNRGHLSDKIIHNLIGELWNSLSDKFIKDDNGLWYNKRLEYEQERRKKYSESRRNNVSKNNICKTHESDMNETCVYIFKDYDTGYIKIGASLNPKNRLSTIKSRQDKPNIKIIATFNDCTLLDEKNIHDKFKEFNIKGDWFSIDENIIIEHMIKHMNKHMITHMENVNVNVNIDNNINKKIPTITEFEKYVLSKEPNIYIHDLKLKYEAWVENGWKDGKDNKIKNWKSKILQTIPHLKKLESTKTVLPQERIINENTIIE